MLDCNASRVTFELDYQRAKMRVGVRVSLDVRSPDGSGLDAYSLDVCKFVIGWWLV